MPRLHLGFLASHGGSNMQAIIDNVKSNLIDAELCCVVSNNSSSFALDRAAKEGIPAFHISDKTHPGNCTDQIINTMKSHNVDTIVLAGYMKMVDARLINSFNGRVLNIHPALLPKFGGHGMYGINVHKAVIEAKETISGATIHLVDSEYDRGRILAQIQVPVFPDDSPETLAERVLQGEHQLYSNTLKHIADGLIII